MLFDQFNAMYKQAPWSKTVLIAMASCKNKILKIIEWLLGFKLM